MATQQIFQSFFTLGLIKQTDAYRLASAVRSSLAFVFSLPLLASCAKISPIPNQESLQITPPEHFSEAGDLATHDKWWTHFSDEHLNTWVDQGLQNNYSLAATWSRLEFNQVNVDNAYDRLLPSARLSAERSRRRISSEDSRGERTTIVTENPVRGFNL